MLELHEKLAEAKSLPDKEFFEREIKSRDGEILERLLTLNLERRGKNGK